VVAAASVHLASLKKPNKDKTTKEAVYNMYNVQHCFEIECSGHPEIVKNLEPEPLQHLQWGARFMASICAVSFSLQTTVTTKEIS